MITDELIANGISLDLKDNVPFPVDMSIQDYREPNKRARSLSKTTELPYTENNYNFFLASFDLTSLGTEYSFNPITKVSAVYKKNGVPLLPNAVIQLKEVKIMNGVPSFVIQLYSEVVDYFLTLSNIKVSELDWSEYDHTLTRANIKASWLTTAGTGYYYPLIERGNGRLGTLIWRTTDMVPYVYLYECFVKMMEYANVKWTSTYLTSSRFKNILFGYGGGEYINKTMTPTELNQRKVLLTNGDLSFSQLLNNINGIPRGLSSTPIKTSIFNITETQDLSDQFESSNIESRFTIQKGGNYSFNISGTINQLISGSGFTYTGGGDMAVFIVKNNSVIDSVFKKVTGDDTDFIIDKTINISVQSGDLLRVFINTYPISGTADVDYNRDITTVVPISMTLQSTDTSVTDGSNVTLNKFIPEKLCSELFMDIVRLANLCVSDPDINGVIRLEPSSTFYTATNNFDDISKVVDHKSEISIKPIANEFSKQFVFRYKENKDYDAEVYYKKYGRRYGDYSFTQGSYYSKGEQKFELGVSSIIPYEISPGILVPRFISKDNSGVSKPVEGSARIMFRNGLKSGAWTFRDALTTSSENMSTYPCVHHFDNWQAPRFDLNFSLVDEVFYTATVVTTTNIYSEYYERFVNELTSPDGKLVSLYVHWSTTDVKGRNFAKLIMFNGALFRLNKIIDFDENISTITKIELTKVLQAQSANRRVISNPRKTPGILDASVLVGAPLVGTGTPVINGGSKGQILEYMKVIRSL